MRTLNDATPVPELLQLCYELRKAWKTKFWSPKTLTAAVCVVLFSSDLGHEWWRKHLSAWNGRRSERTWNKGFSTGLAETPSRIRPGFNSFLPGRPRAGRWSFPCRTLSSSTKGPPTECSLVWDPRLKNKKKPGLSQLWKSTGFIWVIYESLWMKMKVPHMWLYIWLCCLIKGVSFFVVFFLFSCSVN